MRIDWYQLRSRARDEWSRLRKLDPKHNREDLWFVIKVSVVAIAILLVPIFLAVAVIPRLPTTSEVERAMHKAEADRRAEARAKKKAGVVEAKAVTPEAVGRFAAEVLRPALASDERFAKLTVTPEAIEGGGLGLVVRGEAPDEGSLNELRILVESTDPPVPVRLEAVVAKEAPG